MSYTAELPQGGGAQPEALHKHIRYPHTYKACMSPTHNGNSTTQWFKLSDELKVRYRIIVSISDCHKCVLIRMSDCWSCSNKSSLVKNSHKHVLIITVSCTRTTN